MITLKISFLLAIDLKRREDNFADNPKSPKKSPKNKQEQERPKRSKSKSATKEDACPLGYSTIELQTPINYFHLEYDLFGQFKYGIDIICWDSVAKIFTKNGTQCVKTATTDDVIWVPVFIEHYITPLSSEHVRKLLDEKISFCVSSGKNNVGNEAKRDNTTVFYLHDADKANGYFPEVRDHKPENDRQAVLDIIAKIMTQLTMFPIKNDIVTWIYNRDDVHTNNIATIVTKWLRNEELHCKDFVVKEAKITEKKITKQTKKKKKLSPSQRLTEVSIPVNGFISERIAQTYRLNKCEGSLKEFFVLCSCDNVFTNEQKIELGPLAVKIRKISNFPVEELKEQGFQSVFVSCDIPGVQEFVSSRRPLDGTIRFDDSRFIFTKDFYNIRVLEILETTRVIAKIIGVKETVLQPGPETSSNTKKQKQKSKKSNDKESKHRNSKTEKVHEELVILAVSTFDFSPLKKTFNLFKEKAQCHNVQTLVVPKPSFQEFLLDRTTTNEIHLCNIDRNHLTSPLSNNILLSRGTTLKLEANFSHPTNPSINIRDASNIYKRLLVILYEEEVARDLLALIINYNSLHMPGQPLLFPNFLLQRRPGTTTDNVETSRLLSGFFLDDGNNSILFVEGIGNCEILALIHRVTHFNYATARVFFHSDYIYEKPLYATFQSYSGGMFVTSLKQPLVELFSQQKGYLEGNMPYHCFKAIQKFNLIMNSTNLHSILGHDLMPTEVELMSFSLEYCVQLRYKHKVEDTNVRVYRDESDTDFGSRLRL